VSSLEAFFEDEGEDSPLPVDKPMTPRREAAMVRLRRMHERKYTPIVDAETRLRIKVALYAYAYEYESDPLVSDAEFDDLCSKVNLDVNTRRPDLDKWFRSEFSPYTGQWIHDHPELSIIKNIYNSYYRKSNVKKTRTNRKKNQGSTGNS
jgi:hypothetical protein